MEIATPVVGLPGSVDPLGLVPGHPITGVKRRAPGDPPVDVAEMSDLTRSVGVSRKVSERLTKVAESQEACRIAAAPSPCRKRSFLVRAQAAVETATVNGVRIETTFREVWFRSLVPGPNH